MKNMVDTSFRKRKILFISDHLLSTSGVGVQGRYLAYGLVNTGKYTIRQLGGAVKHQNYDVVQPHPDIIIKPVDGFGDKDMIRLLLATEKPDAILLFTDPRFFIWLWEIEDEIHQVCPIIYWHLWDAPPDPTFNAPLFESTDWINCINYPTYERCMSHWPEKTRFIPHAQPTEMFHPLPEAEVVQHRHKMLRGRCDDHFILFWVNRNARRKQPGDLLSGWKLFLDMLEKKEGHRKATLVMHTDPLDNEGPNLFQVVDMLGIRENVFFSTNRSEFQEMNVLHNISDSYINVSSAEGYGLGSLEAMYCGKPVILHSIGGQTRQVVNPYDGTVNGVELKSDVCSLVGSQTVPFIFDYYLKHETIADGIMQLYEMGPEKRKEIGHRAMQYAHKEFGMEKMISDFDETLWNLITKWETDKSSVYQPWEVRTY